MESDNFSKNNGILSVLHTHFVSFSLSLTASLATILPHSPFIYHTGNRFFQKDCSTECWLAVCN